MSSKITITDGVAQLIEEMQRDIENGKIRLSADDWAQLDRKLQDACGLLEKNEISESELKDATWLIIAVFEENESLSEKFADSLAALTGGTTLTGIPLEEADDEGVGLIKNQMRLFGFVKWVMRMGKENQTGQGKKGKDGK